MSSMNILMVGQASMALQTNGVVVSMRTFSLGLARAGHKVTILTPRTNKPAPKMPHPAIHLVELPSLPSPVAVDFPIVWPMAWRGMDDFFQEADVVHLNHPFSMGWQAAKLARRYQKPIVGTYHTLYVEYAKTLVPYAFLAKLGAAEELHRTRRYIATVDEVILPSEPMRRTLQSYGVAKRPMTVIPTGIAQADFKRLKRSALLRQFGIPTNVPLLLFVGRLSDEKNVARVIEILAKLKKRPVPPHAVFIGDGPDHEAYRQLAEQLGVQTRTHFLGRQDKATTNKLMGQGTVFVFPSLTDTQGIVVIEAMAAGTPVVVADKLGPSTLVEDGQTGYLLPTGRMRLVKEGVRRVEQLINDPERWKRFSRAGLKAVQAYTVEATTAKLLVVYERLVG